MGKNGTEWSNFSEKKPHKKPHAIWCGSLKGSSKNPNFPAVVTI